MVVQRGNGGLRAAPRAVAGVGEAAVQAAEGHHQAELVEAAHALEQWDQLVLVHVLGQPPDKHFGPGRRRAAHPAWGGDVRRGIVTHRPGAEFASANAARERGTNVCQGQYNTQVPVLGIITRLS